MCNKVGFDSKTDAKAEAKSIITDSKFRSGRSSKSTKGGKSKKLKPYQCNICKLWHLTSMSRNITRHFNKPIRNRGM